jgi:endoglucanase
MAQKDHQYSNVIYEIYNEPLRDTDWSSVVKPYAEKVISALNAGLALFVSKWGYS